VYLGVILGIFLTFTLEEQKKNMRDKKERVWGNLPFDGHVTGRKPCV
jgi:hypothetical protein